MSGERTADDVRLTTHDRRRTTDNGCYFLCSRGVKNNEDELSSVSDSGTGGKPGLFRGDAASAGGGPGSSPAPLLWGDRGFFFFSSIFLSDLDVILMSYAFPLT